MARAVRWDLEADARKYRRGFREAEIITKRFSGMVTKTAGLVGGAFAAVQVGGFLKDAITEAREAAKVTRQTNAVIKATGGVANVSAKDVDRLADALSTKVGVDDEVIAAGQNMLLTFKGVRNEAGKQNDIFNQATKVALDMTAALNQGEVSQSGLEQSTIRLGKALNDPIAGISALTRVGVTFTDSQKDQIKTLVDSGKTMEAQKIILGELKSEFGGAAEAAADPWDRLSVLFGNVKEQLGTLMVDALEPVAEWLTINIPKAVDTTKEALKKADKWWDENKESVKLLAEVLGGLFVTSSDEAAASTENLTKKTIALEDILKIITGAIAVLVLGWLRLEEEVNGIISVTASFITATGHAINAVDKLRGGSGRAGDAIVEFGEDLKETARVELQGIREDARKAKEAIDRLRGKKVEITGVTSMTFTKNFTAKDWAAARIAAGAPGSAAQGMLVTRGTGPTADDVPIMVSKGEAIVPARAVKDPGFQAWAAGQGIPGFALGGLIGQTGQAHTGVGRIMDRWGTLQLAALIKNLVGGGGSAAIKSWIRAQDPKPYIWGAAGPGGFDCSGIVSAVLGKMLGMSGAGSGLRLFTTGTIGAGQYGLRSGLGGTLQIGVTPGRGHMAGRYGGLGFEAESTRTGIKVGPAASSPESFARRYHHMARGGRITREMLAAYATAAGADVGGDPGALRVGGTRVFDQGGFLPPRSATLAINRTSRAEPVGIDYDRLGQAVARALREQPPVVAVRDLQAGMNHYAGRVGQARPYR